MPKLSYRLVHIIYYMPYIYKIYLCLYIDRQTDRNVRIHNSACDTETSKCYVVKILFWLIKKNELTGADEMVLVHVVCRFDLGRQKVLIDCAPLL